MATSYEGPQKMVRTALSYSKTTTHAAVLLVVTGALAISPMLVPTPTELGAHLLTDQEQSKARPYLEHALREKGFEREVVIPLAKVYGDHGDHQSALKLLQKLDYDKMTVKERAMRRQALLNSGKTFEYIQELEQLRQTRPGTWVLNELARLYGEQQLLELQAQTLDELLKLQPTDTGLAKKVARLWYGLGQKNRALQLLEKIWQTKPHTMEADDFSLFITLLIDLDPSDYANDLIREHLADVGDSAIVVDLAMRFHQTGRFQDAKRLLQPMVKSRDNQPGRLQTWVRTQLALGQTKKAYKTLKKAAASGQLQSEMRPLLCELALKQGELHKALKVAKDANYDGFDGTMLLWLGRTAAGLGKRDVVRQILKKIAKRDLATDPVGVGHMHRVAGARRKALMWARRAQQSKTLSAEQRPWLAELMLLLGKKSAAADVLWAGTKQGLSTPGNVLYLAMLWWRTGAHSRGLRVYSGRRSRRSVAVRAGRLLLLVAAQQTQEALVVVDNKRDVFAALLRQQSGAKATTASRRAGRAMVKSWLQALAQEANNAKCPTIAARAYRHLLALNPRQRRLRIALAQSQLELAQPEHALATLRSLRQPLSADEETVLRQILLAAYRANAPVTAELTTVTVGYLQGFKSVTDDYESWVHLLLEMKADRAALPFIEKLAKARGRPWKGQRIRVLERLGETDRVLALWRKTGLDRDRSLPERTEAAEHLLRADEKKIALQIYQQLAETEGPQSASVKRILHLFGPRPNPAARRWLLTRAQDATGKDRLRWLRHLLWAGEHAQALKLLGDRPRSVAAVNLALDIMVKMHKFNDIHSLTLAVVDRLPSKTTVERLAAVCAGNGKQKAAQRAYKRLLKISPKVPNALRYLAQTVPVKSQRAIYWARYFALPKWQKKDSTWRDRVDYGEALLADLSRREEGQQQLRIGLRLLDAAKLDKQAKHKARGRLLARLQDHNKAVLWLQRALSAQQCDDGLRADLVASLMATHRYEDARRQVDPPARCRRVQDN